MEGGIRDTNSRFKYTTKFSLPKIACPAIVYAEIAVVIVPFFVGVCPWIKVYRYNPTEICQQRLQGVRNVAQKLCSWERSFTRIISLSKETPLNYCIWTASSEFHTYSLCIRAVSPEPSLLAHISSESRGTFRQKARSLAPLNGWACAVKICHDGMFEDTNSLDAAHVMITIMSSNFKLKKKTKNWWLLYEPRQANLCLRAFRHDKF